MKWLSINISKLNSKVQHSISRRTKFSPNLHLLEEETLECLPILQHQYHEFPTLCLKQAALDSWDYIYFGLPYLSQESIVFFQLLVLSWVFSYSLTKLQNYNLCESLINSFEKPKIEKTTTKQINKSLKKHHRYIYLAYDWMGKIHVPRSLGPIRPLSP